jgi:hypothetical protein
MAPLLLLGAAIGGVAMYFLDPDQGRRRRALVRDQAVKTSTHAKHFMEKGARDLKNRGTAVTGRARSLFHRGDASDDVLVERVRSKMGRYTAHPGAIDVNAMQGRVTLSGSILAHEHGELIESVSQVPGVTDIYDRLTIYETAEGISELQGGRARRGEAFLQDNWAPATRLATGAAGTTLALYSLGRSNRSAAFLAFVAGAAILLRAATNTPLRRLAGLERDRAMDKGRTIHVAAPAEEPETSDALDEPPAPSRAANIVMSS